MNLIYVLFFTLLFSSYNVKNNNQSMLGNIPVNSNTSGDGVPSEIVDLLYLKLLTQPFSQPEESIDYTNQYKILVTKSNKLEIDKFDVSWIEMTSGNNYTNSIPWQSNFQDQILYLLNDKWVISEVIPHISNSEFEQKIYIFRRLIKR
tara:strand:+ start:9533 stop:9976 length:444 start_codon:yes stop_codon:yes gene_type:complete